MAKLVRGEVQTAEFHEFSHMKSAVDLHSSNP